MSYPLPAELSLAVACCRWPLDADGERRVRAAAERVADWERFEAVVRRQRIGPLVHHALGRAGVEVPEPVASRLSSRALAAARRSLEMARESLRLQRAIEGAGIAVMVLKGVPVGMLAYGDLAMKESWDIDLLVSADRAVEAMRLLVGLGYEDRLAHLDGDQRDGFVDHCKEAAFFDPRSRMTAEMHWGLVDTRHLLRGIGVGSPAQMVAIPGGQLRTLADGEQFAYLCVHGARHNWGRLKWLADLGALLSRRSEAEIAELYLFAKSVGAGRPAAVALMLCERLFGVAVGEELLRALRRSRIHRALERNVLAGLGHEGGATEQVRYTAPWRREIAAQFFLAPGLRHAIAQMRVFWRLPVDRTRILLPPRLAFLYPWLRVPLWLGRLGSRALGKI